MFPKNVGPTDRAIRIAVGLVLLPTGLLALNALGGSVIGVVLAVAGLIGLVTGATGRCPTYVLFGIDTRREKHPAAAH